MTGFDALIRCDASARLGLGHLRRCEALAQEFHDRGAAVRFLLREDPIARAALGNRWPARWLPAGGAVEEAVAALRAFVHERRPADVRPWVVVDSYDHAARQTWAAREEGAAVIAIDDLGRSDYGAHVILNPGLGADPSAYEAASVSGEMPCKLLGPRYALLRREFRAAQPRLRSGPVRRLLVTLGGSDGENRLAGMLTTLTHVEPVWTGETALDIVVGPGYRWLDNLKHQLGGLRFRPTLHVAPASMAALFEAADLAVTAAGGTVLEAARVGLPVLALVLSDNQRANGRALERYGLGRSLGLAEQASPPEMAQIIETMIEDADERERISRRGPSVVDGQGAARVWDDVQRCASSVAKLCC